MGKEIERKFLLKEMPNLNKICTGDLDMPYTYANIEQYYLSYDPEIRIRKHNNMHFIAYKSDGDLIREELESTISKITFENLKQKAKACIKKTRYYVPNGKHFLEIDEYDNLDLITVEVEFIDEECANSFNPPEWFGKEVTDDERYKNKNLARYGLPEERRQR